MCTKSTGGRRRTPTWQLRVYVADRKTRAAVTIANLERLCEQNLPGRYHIEVVDLLKTPDRCREDGILALPTVVRYYPQPERRAVGTLSNARAAIAALDLDSVQ